MSYAYSLKEKLKNTFVADLYRLYKEYTNPRKKAKKHINKSMEIFKKEYDAYWNTIVQNKNLTSMHKQFDEIRENGYSIVPNYLSKVQLEKIKKEIWSLDGYIDGDYRGDLPFNKLSDDGIKVLGVTEQLPESYAVTIGNEELHNLAKSIYGEHAKLSVASVLNKHDKTKIDSANVPHWDDWRVRFKAFIYLTDVNEENAPMIYVKKSTRENIPWRFEKDYASIFLPIASAGGSWGPVNELGLEKVYCTGKAGTLLLFDADGLHSGTQLKEDIRVMLMNMYTTHLEFTHRPY